MRAASSKDNTRARCALIWSDIGPYHAARSRAAFELTPFVVETIEILGRAGFEEFRAGEAESSMFARHALGLIPPIRVATTRPQLHDLLTRLDPQVVFAPGWSMLESRLAIEWCFMHDVPFVMMSESTRDDQPRAKAKELIKRRIIGLAASAFVGGKPQADYALELGMARDRIFLGYDMVDNDYFATNAALARKNAASLRAQHGLPEHYFLCCARLIEKKNVSRLVDAFAMYRERAGRAAWDLVVVGPGPLRAEIEEVIEARRVSGAVQLVGARDYAALPLYYGLAEAFILPSTMDQWGLVVNEAMAAGLPVLVSTRCGCVRDLVEEGRNGFTFDPFDVRAIADAMFRVALEHCDRAAMGAASQAIITKWGRERFASGFEAAASAALAGPRRASSIIDRTMLWALTVW